MGHRSKSSFFQYFLDRFCNKRISEVVLENYVTSLSYLFDCSPYIYILLSITLPTLSPENPILLSIILPTLSPDNPIIHTACLLNHRYPALTLMLKLMGQVRVVLHGLFCGLGYRCISVF